MKTWSDAEIRELWPQAAWELDGFRRALESKSGLTAAQLGMAIQLADAEFRARTGDSKERTALAEYKRSIDAAWTAGMLAMSRDFAWLTADGFVNYLRDEMRKAEGEYQEAIRRYRVHVLNYTILNSIKSIGDLRALFPDGTADTANWCFLSTGGVHGTYGTLDGMRGPVEDAVELSEESAASELAAMREITVLVVHPRLVCMKYGVIRAETEEDESWLRGLVRSTIHAVGESQEGNL